MTSLTVSVSARRRRAGFTMIELLTVIAIIAILAAILFPVMATVQESTRRGSTMSNMKQIAQAVAAYELDNREYPEYLFGPALCRGTGLADPTCTDFYTMRETASLVNSRPDGSDPVALAASRNARKIFTKSLYPEYIRDISVFSCANNGAARTPDASVALGLRFVVPDRRALSPAMAKQQVPFYKYDAFDASPPITDVNQGKIDNSQLVARYARLWYPVVADPSTLTGATDPTLTDYQRQLIWSRPPAETYITATTHHVPKGKVLLLWQNGSAKVVDILKVKQIPIDPQGDFQFYKMGPLD